MPISFLPLRASVILPVAGAITIGLFLVMRGLIDIGDVRPDPAVERPAVQIRFAPPEAQIEREFPEPPAAVAPPRRAELTPAGRADTGGMDGIAPYALPPIEAAHIVPTSGLVPPDQAPMPIVRIDPVYPASAERRGLEGQCTVIFDITPQGSTTNVRALNCTSTQFERASVNAVSGWRYNPQVRDGQPVMFRGATTQLRYTLNG